MKFMTNVVEYIYANVYTKRWGLALIKLNIEVLKAGMILDEHIFIPNTNKLLLNYGTRLTDKLINLLKHYDIREVAVIERFTLLINPTETMAKELQHALARTPYIRLLFL
jgi:hypothetical protein